MSTLNVLLNGEHVADLDDTAGDGMASLQYTQRALDARPLGAPLLSLRLPVRPQMFPGMDTKAWLDGLMPEGDVRDILAARAKVDKTDLIGFLRAWGRDCAGAVSIVDPTHDPDVPGAVDWLSTEQLEEKIRDLPRAPFGLPGTGKVRVSLGGVQGKLIVVADGNQIGLPEGLTPSTHILKPNPTAKDGTERYPGIVTAEALCMRLFAHLNLDVADVDILDLATGPALLVTRYDRAVTEGKTIRLHQEDLCQAIGVTSALKYQQRSIPASPALGKLVHQLRTFNGANIQALREILGRVYAHALVTNCDAHGKNWSLMLPGTTVELAPVYDVVPSTLWPDVNTELAMEVGNCGLIENLRAEHIVEEARSWGMGPRASRQHLARLHRAVPDALERACADLTAMGGDGAVIGAVAGIVTAQRALLAP